MSPQAPDIVLLAPEWQPRALVRAQLIEEGFEVVATWSWPMMRRHLRPRLKPRLAIVDLKDLAEPQSVLQDLRILMKPDRVLVLSAIGTIPPSEIKRFGYRVVARPFAIEDLVRAVRETIG